jgi:hypothetical protein
LVKLHTVATLASLVQALVYSYQSVGIASAIIGAFSALIYQQNLTSDTVLFKTAISAAVIQLGILVSATGSFTPGEAAFLAQLVVLAKYLWTIGNWTPIQQVTYVLWVSTALGIIITVSLKQFAPFLCNPVVLLTTISSFFAGGSHLLKFDFESLLRMYFFEAKSPHLHL